jgi:uncharacterized membrane protein
MMAVMTMSQTGHGFTIANRAIIVKTNLFRDLNVEERLSPMLLTLLLPCFLLGCVTGLRSLTAPAVVCWAAHFGWLHLAGTNLAFMNHPAALILFTLLAVVELISDKLPKTPARTALPGLIARIVLGGLCGSALAASAGSGLLIAAVVGIVGALFGTFAGYNIRHALVVRAHLPDFAVALVEDAIAIGGGFLIVSHL